NARCDPRRSGGTHLRPAPRGDHLRPAAAPPDLRANRRLRPLRPQRPRSALGADRSRRRAAGRCRRGGSGQAVRLSHGRMARRAGDRARVVWGEPPPTGLLTRLRSLLRPSTRPGPEALPALPLALRRGELAQRYLSAESGADHPRAGAAATTALEEAVAVEAWWPADIWGHRAL